MIGLHPDTHLIVLVFSQLATGEKVTMRGSFGRCSSLGCAGVTQKELLTFDRDCWPHVLQFEPRYVVVPTNPQSPHDSGPEGKGGMIWILTGKWHSTIYYR